MCDGSMSRYEIQRADMASGQISLKCGLAHNRWYETLSFSYFQQFVVPKLVKLGLTN